MRWIFPLLLTHGTLLADASNKVEFNRDVRPILSDRCFACHGPDPGNRKSVLRLDNEKDAKKDLGKGRKAIVPGEPSSSGLIERVTSTHKVRRMPPAYLGHDALPQRDIDTLRRWIEQGAEWQDHWSFLSPERPELPPEVERSSAIDHFVKARLDEEGLRLSPEADKRTLLRRVSLDMTGMPPTSDEVDAFVADTSREAYERVVDRLLASDEHAERQATRWLDYARYSDTNGYQTDGPRDMWRWRDWVIEAFRSNMPFDRFTVEQLAGDLLEDASRSQRIATGFNRNHRTSAEGGIVDEEFRVEYVADRVETTSNVWLGLTVGCARCHDHKYDPIRQKEFYQLFAYFNNVPEKGFVYNFGNEPPYIKAPLPEQEKRLAELDRAAADAIQEWDAQAGARQEAFKKWQGKIAGKKKDWIPEEALVLEHSKTVTDRVEDLGRKIGRFNHRDPFTLSAWVKPRTLNGAILTRTEDHAEGSGYGLYVMNGKLRFHYIFRWTDLGLRVETEKPLAQDEWQHVAMTYDGGMYAKGVRLFIDGKEQKLNILFDQNLWPLDSKAPLRIGAGAGLAFEGDVKEARIWSRDLTKDEVSTLAVSEAPGELAALPSRTPAQEAKLRLAFEQEYLPKKQRAIRLRVMQTTRMRGQYAAQLPTVMVMQEGPSRQAYLLERGAYDKHGEPVSPGTPEALPALPADAPPNRLGLARWIVSRGNPLTARVQVNRLWQGLFGNGLVKTVEDFGSQGEWPSHPELLDWLAVEFMDSGWNLQHIEKLMVMSRAYRQSSDVTPELLQKDPENRLLARAARLRLAAPFIRDQALAVSGLLVRKVGGPSVKPYQPEGLWQELAGGKGYSQGTGEDLYRRSLYTYWKRTVAPPNMVNFDAATREFCSVRESRTNTPLQALNLMNDVAYLEASRKLAERVLSEGGEDNSGRIDYAYTLLLSRPAKPAERTVILDTLQRFQERYRSSKKDAKALLAQGASPRDEDLKVADLAAWTTVASLLLNLDETITRE